MSFPAKFKLVTPSATWTWEATTEMCPMGCGVPMAVMTDERPHDKEIGGEWTFTHHDCERTPEKMLSHLLAQIPTASFGMTWWERIASEHNSAAANGLRDWLKKHGVPLPQRRSRL